MDVTGVTVSQFEALRHCQTNGKLSTLNVEIVGANPGFQTTHSAAIYNHFVLILSLEAR
jgi:hypothetical protein